MKPRHWQPMKCATLLLAVLCSTIAHAQLEEVPVRVSGVVSLRVFPGPPNYESIARGDAREEAWILTVSNAGRKEEFHLVILDDTGGKFAKLRQAKGKALTVEGMKCEAHTAHHHAPFLITVSAIHEAAAKPGKPGGSK